MVGDWLMLRLSVIVFHCLSSWPMNVFVKAAQFLLFQIWVNTFHCACDSQGRFSGTPWGIVWHKRSTNFTNEHIFWVRFFEFNDIFLKVPSSSPLLLYYQVCIKSICCSRTWVQSTEPDWTEIERHVLVWVMHSMKTAAAGTTQGNSHVQTHRSILHTHTHKQRNLTIIIRIIIAYQGLRGIFAPPDSWLICEQIISQHPRQLLFKLRCGVPDRIPSLQSDYHWYEKGFLLRCFFILIFSEWHFSLTHWRPSVYSH